ncbi:hypothetical protein VIGAN_01128800 [Vigna angularis var. angularis]|uniref:Uncharacterized protein n=1 Tax=Vigna angularis var. angularis TaxID=157739 RepID=A0A0S3QZM8_PHAAN|nr:hypothetical protein VIGAN_01128800 [Vigna angularis var. angularis]
MQLPIRKQTLILKRKEEILRKTTGISNKKRGCGWDTIVADPKLLVFLKSFPNTLPVCRHCCQKRKFWLVFFCFLMHAYIEKEESKMLKHKQKECMQPKMQ